MTLLPQGIQWPVALSHNLKQHCLHIDWLVCCVTVVCRVVISDGVMLQTA